MGFIVDFFNKVKDKCNLLKKQKPVKLQAFIQLLIKENILEI